MKEFWFTVILFIIIVGCVTANAIYVSAVSEKLESLSEKIDYEKSPEALLDELQDFWNKNKKLVGISVDTPQIDSIEKIIISLKLAYEKKERFEFEKYRLHLSEVSKEMSRLETLSLQTVF